LSLLRSAKLLALPWERVTPGILPFALRAVSLWSTFKFAPGEFVSHSAISPETRLSLLRSAKLLALPWERVTPGILPFALRAVSLWSTFKFAPGEFVSHSAISPERGILNGWTGMVNP
jgi:hypothetical protein